MNCRRCAGEIPDSEPVPISVYPICRPCRSRIGELVSLGNEAIANGAPVVQTLLMVTHGIEGAKGMDA